MRALALALVLLSACARPLGDPVPPLPRPPATGGGLAPGAGGAPPDPGTGGLAVGGSPVPATGGAGGSGAEVPGQETSPEAPVEVEPLPTGRWIVYVGGDFTGRQVTVFDFNPATGELTRKPSVTVGTGPTTVAAHPNGKYLYVGNETDPGRVNAFSIDPMTGALGPLNNQPSGGDGPAFITVHRGGNYLLVANYNDGRVATHAIAADGRLGPPAAVVAGSQVHMLLDEPVAGRFLSAPCRGIDRVAQFSLDLATGRMTPATPPTVDAGDGPRHIAFHPSGRFAYVIGEDDGFVRTYAHDPATGALTATGAMDLGTEGVHLAVHPSGRFLYALMRGSNALHVLAIDPGAGTVTPASRVDSGLARPWDFALGPGGRHLIVANTTNRAIKVYAVDPVTGALAPLGAGGIAAEVPRSVAIVALPGT